MSTVSYAGESLHKQATRRSIQVKGWLAKSIRLVSSARTVLSKFRTNLLSLCGYGCFVGSAFTVNETLGLFVAGLAFVALSIQSSGGVK